MRFKMSGLRRYRDVLACEGWTGCIQPDAGPDSIALREPDDSRADFAWCHARTDADSDGCHALDCDAVHGHTIDHHAVHGHTVDCDTLHAQLGGPEHGDTEVISLVCGDALQTERFASAARRRPARRSRARPRPAWPHQGIAIRGTI